MNFYRFRVSQHSLRDAPYCVNFSRLDNVMSRIIDRLENSPKRYKTREEIIYLFNIQGDQEVTHFFPIIISHKFEFWYRYIIIKYHFRSIFSILLLFITNVIIWIIFKIKLKKIKRSISMLDVIRSLQVLLYYRILSLPLSLWAIILEQA